MARKWTTLEVRALVEMRHDGLTTYAIARIMGRSEGSVRGCISRVGATSSPRWTASEVEFLQENYQELGACECAARLLRTPRAVECKAGRLGLTGGRSD